MAQQKEVVMTYNLVGFSAKADPKDKDSESKQAISAARIVKGRPYPLDPSLIVSEEPTVLREGADLFKIITRCHPRPMKAGAEGRMPARYPITSELAAAGAE